MRVSLPIVAAAIRAGKSIHVGADRLHTRHEGRTLTEPPRKADQAFTLLRQMTQCRVCPFPHMPAYATSCAMRRANPLTFLSRSMIIMSHTRRSAASNK